MAVISEVKCGRCDRRYSGFRSRCPYCGARRNKRGKQADEADNKKAKLVIGVLLLILLIVATMILIFTSLPDNTAPSAVTDSDTATTDAEPTYSAGEDIDTVEKSPDPDTASSPSPTASAPVVVTQVNIVSGGAVTNDVTLLKIGDTWRMKFTTVPETTGKQGTWASSDETVFTVLSNGQITAIGKGSATLTVTVDGVVSNKCIVRVKGK